MIKKGILNFIAAIFFLFVFAGTGCYFGYHWSEENKTNIIILLLIGLVYCVITNFFILRLPQNKAGQTDKTMKLLQIAIITYSVILCMSLGFIIGLKESHEEYKVPSAFGGSSIILLLLTMLYQKKKKQHSAC